MAATTEIFEPFSESLLLALHVCSGWLLSVQSVPALCRYQVAVAGRSTAVVVAKLQPTSQMRNPIKPRTTNTKPPPSAPSIILSRKVDCDAW